jgi:hypothetical protein
MRITSEWALAVPFAASRELDLHPNWIPKNGHWILHRLAEKTTLPFTSMIFRFGG